MVCWQKLHSFANFGLWVGLCDLQMCAMCVGFPNCPEGQKRVGKTKSSSKQSLFFFLGLAHYLFPVLFLQFNLAGNGGGMRSWLSDESLTSPTETEVGTRFDLSNPHKPSHALYHVLCAGFYSFIFKIILVLS